MYSLALPAGSPIAFSITARPERGRHRWAVNVVADDTAELRAAYTSLIGGDDLTQRVAVPAQAMDCHLEVGATREIDGGWTDSHMSVAETSQAGLNIGFCDLAAPGSRHDDVLLTFTFPAPAQGHAGMEGQTT